MFVVYLRGLGLPASAVDRGVSEVMLRLVLETVAKEDSDALISEGTLNGGPTSE